MLDERDACFYPHIDQVLLWSFFLKRCMVVVNLNSLDEPIPRSHCLFKIHFESRTYEAIRPHGSITMVFYIVENHLTNCLMQKDPWRLNLKGDGKNLSTFMMSRNLSKTVSQYECSRATLQQIDS